MNDPRRLLAGADEFERELLGAARVDQGSRAAYARCVAAASALPLAATVTSAASAGTPLVLAAAKSLVIGVAIGVAVSGAGLAVSQREGASVGARVAAPSPRQAEPSRDRARAPGEQTAPQPSATPPSASEVPLEAAGSAQISSARHPLAERALPPTPNAASASTANANTPDRNLEREVAVLDAVRAALSRADSAGASAALDRYQREFGAGTLAPEALLLRVQTLMAQGRRSSAEAVGRRFLAAYPTAAYRQRLEAIMAGRAAGPSGSGDDFVIERGPSQRGQ